MAGGQKTDGEILPRGKTRIEIPFTEVPSHRASGGNVEKKLFWKIKRFLKFVLELLDLSSYHSNQFLLKRRSRACVSE